MEDNVGVIFMTSPWWEGCLVNKTHVLGAKEIEKWVDTENFVYQKITQRGCKSKSQSGRR